MAVPSLSLPTRSAPSRTRTRTMGGSEWERILTHGARAVCCWLDQVNQAINKQLEPLAEEYPYLRAVRH